MPIYREYLNENAHRYYPFINENEVPTGLILDACLLTTTNVPNNANVDGNNDAVGTESTYISQLVSDGTSLRIYLAIKSQNGDKDCGCIAVSDTSQPLVVGGVVGRRCEVLYASDGYVIQGYIIVGDLEYLLPKMPPSITLTYLTGKLYTNCILHMSQWLTGIQIGNETLTGIVNLVAGEGIDIAVNGNTITISCVGAQLPPENQIIVSDPDILTKITETYGVPITSINGVSITEGGEWTLAVKQDEGLTVSVDNTAHCITINNPLAKACCTADQISVLASNIGSLNERVGAIQSFQNQLETGMNILSTQLTRLQ